MPIIPLLHEIFSYKVGKGCSELYDICCDLTSH